MKEKKKEMEVRKHPAKISEAGCGTLCCHHETWLVIPSAGFKWNGVVCSLEHKKAKLNLDKVFKLLSKWPKCLLQ